MGDELGEYFYALLGEYVWLTTKMDDWHDLFFVSEERWRLLQETAAPFFNQLQRIYRESVILHICRMTDRENRGYKFVSINGVPPLINNQKLILEFNKRVHLIRKAAEPCRVWRNNLIAHRTRGGGLPSGEIAIDGLSWKQLDGIRLALHEALALVYSSYMNSELAEDILRPAGTAEALICHLKTSQFFEQKRRKASKKPGFRWEEWRIGEI